MAQVRGLGPKKGRQPCGTVLCSSHEPGELLAMTLSREDSTINIILVLLLLLLLSLSLMTSLFIALAIFINNKKAVLLQR